MLKVMLVAGAKTDDLAEYFASRGSIEVVHKYDDLRSNLKYLREEMVREDKFVYIHDSNSSIREDMQALKIIFENNAFFRPNQIIVFIRENEFMEQNLKFFRAVMEDAKFDNYFIHKQREKQALDYATIYERLLGFGTKTTIKNTYTNIYRAERGEQSKDSYEPEDTSKLVLEPFSYKNINVYETTKSTALKSDNGLPVVEVGERIHDKFEEVTLPSVKPKEIVSDNNVYLVTGMSQSGSTTYCCALAMSTVYSSKKCILVDLCKNNGAKILLDECKVDYNFIELKDVLLGSYEVKNDKLNLISAYTSNDVDTRLDLLRYIRNNLKLEDYDALLINFEMKDLDEVVYLTSHSLSAIYLSTHMLETEIKIIQNVLYKVVDKSRVFILLNDNINYMHFQRQLSPVEIRDLIKINATIIKPLPLYDLYVDGEFYQKLMEE